MDLGAPLSRSNSSERTNGSPERGHPLLYRRHRRLDVLEAFTPIFVPTMTGHPIFDTKEAFRESVSRPDHIPGVASPLPEDQYMRFLWGNLGLSLLHVISHTSDRRSAFPLSPSRIPDQASGSGTSRVHTVEGDFCPRHPPSREPQSGDPQDRGKRVLSTSGCLSPNRHF